MISIIHPSARPEKALETAQAWMAALYVGRELEYVLCLDWGVQVPQNMPPWVKIVWNYGRKCSVDATNTGAQNATGDMLVVVSDDVRPEGDSAVLRELVYYEYDIWQARYYGCPYVIAVDTQDQDDPTHTLTVQILNRARYEQIGYIFHPDYTSMYADDEFTEHAKKDGVLYEALHIKMKHERFEWDEAYARQQGEARFVWGKALLEHRRKHGFPRVTPGLASMREVVNIWNLGEGRITGDVEKAIAVLEGPEEYGN